MKLLPINVQYTIIDKKYIPLMDGCQTCDNCGRPIANIATVKSNNSTYNIGFDCLETVLIASNLCSSVDVLGYEHVKKMIPKILTFAKKIRSEINLRPDLELIVFEKQTRKNDWFTYYLQCNGKKPCNRSIKIKELDLDFLIKTLQAIFPRITICVENDEWLFKYCKSISITF